MNHLHFHVLRRGYGQRSERGGRSLISEADEVTLPPDPPSVQVAAGLMHSIESEKPVTIQATYNPRQREKIRS